MKTKKAFTLIELLVVIAIIALLLAIVLPAFNQAKQIAASVVCMSNQKQLGLAYVLYAEENNGKLVEARPGKDGYVIDSDGVAHRTWVDAPTPAEDKTLDGKIQALRDGGMWQYLESHKVFNCPYDRRWKSPYTGPGAQPGDLGGYRSYSLGGVLSVFAPSGLGEADYGITSYGKFTTPSEKFVFIEEADNQNQSNGNHWDMYLNDERWYDPLAIVHNGSSTFSYADGHAGKFKWTDKEMIEMSQGIEPIKRRLIDPSSNDYYLFKRSYIPGRKQR